MYEVNSKQTIQVFRQVLILRFKFPYKQRVLHDIALFLLTCRKTAFLCLEEVTQVCWWSLSSQTISAFVLKKRHCLDTAQMCSEVISSYKLVISSYKLVYKYTVQCFSILYFTFDNDLEIHVRTEILRLFILCQFLAYTYILS